MINPFMSSYLAYPFLHQWHLSWIRSCSFRSRKRTIIESDEEEEEELEEGPQGTTPNGAAREKGKRNLDEEEEEEEEDVEPSPGVGRAAAGEDGPSVGGCRCCD